MNNELLALYKKCREKKPFMLSGRDAECSLSAAKTILAFREAESDGLVRMRCEPEQESYFSVFGDAEIEDASRNGHPISKDEARKQLVEILERHGVWWTCSEWFDGEEWHHADSCGMHTGYGRPLDPFENCYIVDEMQSALDELAKHQATIRETQLAECCP